MTERIAGFIVISIFIYVAIRYAAYLIRRLMHAVRRRYPVKIIESVCLGDLEQISPAVTGTVTSYLKHVNSINDYARYVTPVFIKEVYYATTQGPLREIPVTEMKKALREASAARAAFVSCMVDEVVKLQENRVLVGVTRKFQHGEENRVKYMAERIGREWKISHIARTSKGTVKEKVALREGIGYLIGNEDKAMFFVDSVDRNIRIHDYVYVEGYLETGYLISNRFFYHVVTLQTVQ
ncbi:hypothetical protein [Paenibacillus sp. MBLB4367]|uniref:hypothetical protein n=1 Tax=Paenibacillus sp. MBLB4367 TaxID=3384767 RepID=UPI0039081E41